MPRIAARNPEISRDRTIYVELISGGVIRITRVVGEMQEGTILPEWVLYWPLQSRSECSCR